MRNLWRKFRTESGFHVLLHGIHRQRRGKSLSATFMGELNPKKALEKAQAVLRTAAVLPLPPHDGHYPLELLMAVKRQLTAAFPFEMSLNRLAGYGHLRRLFIEAQDRPLDPLERAFLTEFRKEVDLDRESFSNPDDGEELAYASCWDDLNKIDAILER